VVGETLHIKIFVQIKFTSGTEGERIEPSAQQVVKPEKEALKCEKFNM
jgi:hypothetical protein